MNNAVFRNREHGLWHAAAQGTPAMQSIRQSKAPPADLLAAPARQSTTSLILQ